MDLVGLNQLWVAAITCIRLRPEFVSAVTLDAYPRRVASLLSINASLEAEATAGLAADPARAGESPTTHAWAPSSSARQRVRLSPGSHVAG